MSEAPQSRLEIAHIGRGVGVVVLAIVALATMARRRGDGIPAEPS